MSMNGKRKEKIPDDFDLLRFTNDKCRRADHDPLTTVLIRSKRWVETSRSVEKFIRSGDLALRMVEQILPRLEMSWVPITAIQDLSGNLRYLNQEDVEEILNNLTVSRSYHGVSHYRLSDVERALQQLGDVDQNTVMYIRGAAIVISNGNNGGNGNQRPTNGNGNGNVNQRPGGNGNGNGNQRPMPPMPSANGGVHIYLDANTFRNLFRPCQ